MAERTAAQKVAAKKANDLSDERNVAEEIPAFVDIALAALYVAVVKSHTMRRAGTRDRLEAALLKPLRDIADKAHLNVVALQREHDRQYAIAWPDSA